MKNIVIFDSYNEIDLKPSDLLKKYLELTEKDVASFLLASGRLKECACPGCLSGKTRSSFEKFGLRYMECADCCTLYVSPRPSEADISNYYRNSSARAYWRDRLSKTTDKKRKEKIVKPRFQWIMDSTREYLPEAAHLADINTLNASYLEEIEGADIFKRKTLIDPLLDCGNAASRKGMDIVNVPLEEAGFEDEVDVVSLFEVLDRTADVEALFKKVRSMLKTGGLCFITAILASGFNIQVLWDKAENVFPPDRLNLFSLEGMKSLFSRHGFECLELSTPGILDVEIVDRVVRSDPSIGLPRFIEYIMKDRPEDVRKALQEFLQANLLSSYGRILIRKKESDGHVSH